MQSFKRSVENIAILTPALTGGGAERVAQNLATGLTRRGARIQMLTFASEPARASEEQVAADALLAGGVRVCRIPHHRARKGIPALINCLRQERPSVLISHLEYLNLTAILCGWLSRTSTRVVVVNHIQLSADTCSQASRRVRLLPWLARIGYPMAHRVVCVSHGSADDLARVIGLPRDRIKVIYNPVIGPGYQKRLQTEVTHPWFTPGQRPVLISAGRMVPQKDFTTLIAAFALVRREKAARLVIFGDGPLRAALEQQVRESGLGEDVAFPGYVESLPAYMKLARAFVLSSQWEALPTVLIEAMAAGCRVISTDCPSGPREILADGRHGSLVPMGNATALAQAMLDEIAIPNPTAPPPASWRAFEEDNACEEYLRQCQ